MTVSVSVRFEVFKRDRFTCSYCGKHPPEVLLEIDHIVPLAAGGSDEIVNLTTACWDCNRGKGARLLEEGTAPVPSLETLQHLEERVTQAKAYMELVAQQQSVMDQMVDRVNEAWGRVFGAKTIEQDGQTFWQFDMGYWPDSPSVRTILRRLGLDQTLSAVDITARKFRLPSDDARRYFYGTCWGMIKSGEKPEYAPPSFDDGRDEALRQAGEQIKHWQEHGFASLADAVLAWFPDDD